MLEEMHVCGRWNATVTSVFNGSFFKKILLLQEELIYLGENRETIRYGFMYFRTFGVWLHIVLLKQECKKTLSSENLKGTRRKS